jgi:FtsP/CotA-like multicopper oxidase with cupredoxin domain
MASSRPSHRDLRVGTHQSPRSVIRAEVGDSLKIVFKNNGSLPFTIYAHGVGYDQGSDGMTGGPPGTIFIYTRVVDHRSGPQPGEPSSKFWLYHSHANEQRDTAPGLVGPIIVNAKGMSRPAQRQKMSTARSSPVLHASGEPELVSEREYRDVHCQSNGPQTHRRRQPRF